MSISKVRVYELTRELDLETKDILAICEQLNIAVKSHSSTITESEAEQIRSVASDKRSAKGKEPAKEMKEKEADSRIVKPQILSVINPAARLAMPPNTTIAPESRSLPEVEPEIIAVEQPQPAAQPEVLSESLPESRVPEVVDSSSDISSPPEPTRPPATTQTHTKTQIAKPPLRPGQAKETTVASVAVDASADTDATLSTPQPVTLETKPLLPEVKPTEPIKPLPALKVKQSAPAPIATAPVPTAIKPAPLKAQPAKQQKTQPKEGVESGKADSKSEVNSPPPVNAASTGNKVVTKPRLDRPKPAASGTVSPNANPKIETAPPKRPMPNRPAPVKDAVLIERGITAPSDPPHPLRAPIAPVRPNPKVVDAKGDRTTEKPTLNGPRRDNNADALAIAPVAPVLAGRGADANRPSKRNKNKKAEDEVDLLEMKEKAAKLNRPKRYLQVLDDDDDLIDDLDDGSEMPDVSLSIARPTARPKQRVAKPAAPLMDPKLGGAKTSGKRASYRDRDRTRTQEVVVEKPTKIILQESITVEELAARLAIAETEIIRALFLKGLMVNINQTLDIPTATMVATELGYEVEQGTVEEPARKVTEMIEAGDLEYLHRRPPVVTIMGHVDHGKTTLLDSIRKSKVAQGEAGGITQHIGAYHVDVEHAGKQQQIVFLDTPGHEAFTAMRARGARVTDVAILVVAADDGVQPQTIEAISHARAAKVPILVAINKIDKLEAQPDRIRQELTEHGLVDEEWGGDTIMVPVSAMKGENLDTLLEMILLVAEVEDLQANPDRSAKGTVIEANLDKARGPVATLLIQNGTLRVGDVLVAGSTFGKVRAMIDDHGKRVDAATPSFAVEVLGLSDVPAAGDEFEVFTDEKLARAIASERSSQQRQSRLQQSMASRRITLGTVSAKVQEGELKELNLILKADVQGSVEAILGALNQLPQNEVQLRVLLAAAGEITENDVDLAAASEGVIIGFNTTMASGARQESDALGVDVRDYTIIYKLLEDIQGAMEGLLEPELIEEPLGQAEVRAIFTIGRGAVAGCYVLSGKLTRNCKVRIKRHNDLIHEASLDSLRRMKEDTKEVAAGFECGVSLPKFSDWQVGDIIEAFRFVTKRRTLSA